MIYVTKLIFTGQAREKPKYTRSIRQRSVRQRNAFRPIVFVGNAHFSKTLIFQVNQGRVSLRRKGIFSAITRRAVNQERKVYDKKMV